MNKAKEVNSDRLVTLRRELHRIAEQSGREKKTAEKIVDYLQQTGPDRVLTGVGGHGLLALYKGREEGPRVMIRCELDALPIPEENDFEYRSAREGVSHKCGHDGHMAIVAGVADRLESAPPETGEVVLLFQPSEETGEGARRILDDEQFQSLAPDYIFALHNLPGYEKQQVVIRDGVFAAASVGLSIRLEGETSHAAHPEEGNSPAPAVAQLIESLSAVPQYYTSIDTAAKVTVIHAKVGEVAFGTSPGRGEVMATLRTYSGDQMERLKEKTMELTRGVAATYGLDVETEWVEPFAETRNDPRCTGRVKDAAENRGLEILEKDTPFGWSEDFGYFTHAYSGALFGLGAGRDQPPLHAPDYDFPDDLIPTGVALFTDIIEQLTQKET